MWCWVVRGAQCSSEGGHVLPGGIWEDSGSEVVVVHEGPAGVGGVRGVP